MKFAGQMGLAAVTLAATVMFSPATAQVVTAQQTAAQNRLKTVLADPSATRNAVVAGKKASFFCANCHGEDGNSRYPEVPNLAGQHPVYLLEQIRKFGSGQRKDQFMQGLIKVLSEEEQVQIAVYFAESKVKPGRSDAALAAQGKSLFGKLCVRCHGEQARGAEAIPRLAGQQREYLTKSITRYRDKTGERINTLMQIATAPLSNGDIAAITAYLTSLR